MSLVKAVNDLAIAIAKEITKRCNNCSNSKYEDKINEIINYLNSKGAQIELLKKEESPTPQPPSPPPQPPVPPADPLDKFKSNPKLDANKVITTDEKLIAHYGIKTNGSFDYEFPTKNLVPQILQSGVKKFNVGIQIEGTYYSLNSNPIPVEKISYSSDGMYVSDGLCDLIHSDLPDNTEFFLFNADASSGGNTSEGRILDVSKKLSTNGFSMFPITDIENGAVFVHLAGVSTEMSNALNAAKKAVSFYIAIKKENDYIALSKNPIKREDLVVGLNEINLKNGAKLDAIEGKVNGGVDELFFFIGEEKEDVAPSEEYKTFAKSSVDGEFVVTREFKNGQIYLLFKPNSNTTFAAALEGKLKGKKAYLCIDYPSDSSKVVALTKEPINTDDWHFMNSLFRKRTGQKIDFEQTSTIAANAKVYIIGA